MSVVRHESFLIFEVSRFSGGGSLFSLCWCCWSISFTFVEQLAQAGSPMVQQDGWHTLLEPFFFLFFFFALLLLWNMLSPHSFCADVAAALLPLFFRAGRKELKFESVCYDVKMTLRFCGAQKFAGSETMWSKVQTPASVLRGIQWFLLHRCRLLRFLLGLH